MSSNYTVQVQAFLSTLPGHTPEQANLLGQFAAYLQGQSSRTSHGGSRPKAGTITGSVWDWCDRFVAANNRVPTRKEAVDALDGSINYHTVTTQYQAWKTHSGHSTKAAAPQAAAPVQATPPVVHKATPVGLVDPSGQVVA